MDGSRQYSVASILIVMSAVAGVVALGKLWQGHGGYYLALPVATLPFAYIVELAFRAGKSSSSPAKVPSGIDAPLRFSRVGLRLGVVGLSSTVPAIASWMGLVDQTSWWSPCPWLMFLPLAYLDTAFYFAGYSEAWSEYGMYLALAIPIVVYGALVLPAAFTVSDRLPLRLLVVLGIGSMASLYWFGTALASGVASKYQSDTYIVGSLAANIGCISLLWLTWWLCRKRFHFTLVILWAMLLVSWLFWLAFPWLGEYI